MIFPIASRNYIFSPRNAFSGAGASPATQNSSQVAFVPVFKSSDGCRKPFLVAKRRRLGSTGKLDLRRLGICDQGDSTHTLAEDGAVIQAAPSSHVPG